MKLSKILMLMSGIYLLSSLVLYLLTLISTFSLTVKEILFITSGSFLISVIILIILYKGSRKKPQTRVLYTLSGIGLKFMLYLLLIIIAYFFIKILSMEFIVTFFVIYLTFTSLVLFSVLNLLKSQNN